MESLEPQLQELLSKYKTHFSIQENGKIKCEINGHTLPPRHDAVASFIQGAKFQKLLRRHQAEDALKKYEPFIVQSKNFPLMLYCALTGQLMDKSVDAVKKHMQGKKFLRAKERFTNDEIDLKPEPSLQSFGIKLPEDEQQQHDEQQQQQPANKKAKKQQQQHHQGKQAAAAAAEGSEGEDDGPGFWVPSGDEKGSDDESGDSDDASGSEQQQSDAGDVDMENGDEEQAAGPSSAEPMDEDAPAQKQQQQVKANGARKKGAATTAAAAAGSSKGGKQQRKQQQKTSKLAAAGSNAGTKKKHNVNRPSAAKKAKR